MVPGSSQILVLLVAAAALTASGGCVISRPGRTCRIWADCNTLRAPALFIEETSHLPYPAHRVKHYRWMYNAGTLAERYTGAIRPTGSISPVPVPKADPDRLVPPPRQPDSPGDENSDSQLPPLPTRTDLLDDQPAPSRPLPQSGPSNSDDGDGPTAARNPSRI